MSRLKWLLAAFVVAVVMTGCNDTSNSNSVGNTSSGSNANSNTSRAAATNENKNSSILNTNFTREDYEKNKDKVEKEAKSLGSKIGNGLEDGYVWSKVRYELSTANDLRDSTINVDVDNGVVTLTGSVASSVQKAKAIETAKAVNGVKSVKDELKISASGNSNSNTKNENTVNKNTANKNAKGKG